MSGIIGVVGRSDVGRLLVEGLGKLENPRCDSCGLAILNEENIYLRKDVGAVEEVTDGLRVSARGPLGIAHTRRATHGVVAPENAHPHLSCDRSFAVVHNGIISNYQEIKRGLQDQGEHFFFSDTDTEVIAHLMEEASGPGLSVEEAFVRVLRRLEGSFAIAAISTYEPRKIFCARQQSSLVLGITCGVKFVSSETSALLPYAHRSVPLEDGEYAVLSAESYSIRDIVSGQERNN